jgi:hypothetical protein
MRTQKSAADRFGKLLFCWMLLVAFPLGAQTLDEQYAYYLDARCTQMGFARDADRNLLPGQAGPTLEKYCSGLPSTGGGSSTTASGGGAGAASGQGGAAATDAALRKRRKRSPDGDGLPDDDTVSITNQGRLSAYLSADFQQQHQHPTHYEAGRRADRVGLLLGSDYRFGTRGVAGIAARLQRQSGDFDGSAGDFEVHSAGAVFYGSWFPTANLFIDVTAGLDDRRLEMRRIVALRKEVQGNPRFPPNVFYDPEAAPADSTTGGLESTAGLHSGMDFQIGALTLGPRVGIAVRRTHTDAFTERGDTPMTLAFDAQTEDSLTTAVGLQASHAATVRNAAVVTQFNVDWMHEYRDDQRVMTAHFAEDLRPDATQLRFLNQPPDRDVFVARLGLVAVLPNGMSLFGTGEVLLGHDYLDRHAVTIGVRKEF